MTRGPQTVREAAYDALRKMREMFKIAREAELALDDPGMQRAIMDVRTAAVESFRNSAPGETAVRENAYWMLRALDGVEDALANHVAQYRFAKSQEDEDGSPRQRRRLTQPGE